MIAVFQIAVFDVQIFYFEVLNLRGVRKWIFSDSGF